MCCEAGLVGTATLLVAVALGILLIMLRLSRQHAYVDRSSSGHGHRRFTVASNDNNDVTGTCSAVNLIVNPVDLLLQRQQVITANFFAIMSFDNGWPAR